MPFDFMTFPNILIGKQRLNFWLIDFELWPYDLSRHQLRMHNFYYHLSTHQVWAQSDLLFRSSRPTFSLTKHSHILSHSYTQTLTILLLCEVQYFISLSITFSEMRQGEIGTSVSVYNIVRKIKLYYLIFFCIDVNLRPGDEPCTPSHR